ncbi:MAG: hypothetical protein GX027_05430 [Clostridiaceae bacterium]|jgi:hypothetical protein|nr:hypothetical protein [Clostridiaceae bacterium]
MQYGIEGYGKTIYIDFDRNTSEAISITASSTYTYSFEDVETVTINIGNAVKSIKATFPFFTACYEPDGRITNGLIIFDEKVYKVFAPVEYMGFSEQNKRYFLEEYLILYGECRHKGSLQNKHGIETEYQINCSDSSFGCSILAHKPDGEGIWIVIIIQSGLPEALVQEIDALCQRIINEIVLE